MKSLFMSGLIFCFVLCAAQFARAQVMQSSNYRIQSDSVNTAGNRSTSTNYRLEDTVGEVATGESESATYQMNAGYQQTLEQYLAISAVADVTMSPSLALTGGTSNGSTTVTVTADGRAGYQLTIKASQSPAMQSSSDTIDDYTAAGANPDFTFAVAASDAEFAFSPEGSEIASRYKDDGSSCSTGSADASLSCWDALSTSERVIATRTSGNHPNGTATVIRFRAEIGTSASVTAGTYVATTTVTATAL